MARKLEITIKDLVIPSGKTYLKSFVFEPTTPKKEPVKLVGVFGLEIDDKRKAQEIVEKIISSLKEKYNQGLSFEDALNAVNETLAGIVQKGETDWIGKLHSSLIFFEGKIITLSSTGKAKALLLRGNDLIDISEGVASSTPSPLKTFTNIVSGSLEDEDKLILSTSSFFEFVSLDTTKRIFLDLPLDLACSKLKNTLTNAPLGLVVLEAKKVREFKEIKPQIRYPSLEIEADKQAFLPKESLIKLAGVGGKLVKGGAQATSQIFRKAKGIIEKGKPSLHRVKSGSFFNIKWEELKKFFRDMPRNYRRLPRASRIYFIAALVLIVLFCGSVAIISYRKKEDARLAQFEEWLSSAQDKEKQASDALIYKDEEKAKALLVEAKDLLDKILKEKRIPKEQRQEAESLSSKIQEGLDKTEHIVRVQPEELANFQNVEPQISPKNLVGIKDEVYSFNQETNAIFSLDKEAKQLVTLPVTSQDIGHLVLAETIPDKNKIIFYTDRPAIAELNLKENKLIKVETEFAHEDQNVKDLACYLDKIYLLDVAHNQIYKHSRTISGYSKGQAWLNKEINLENAQSLAIDGDIWVLTSDGQVLKFFAGDLQEFSLGQLAEPLDCPTEIKTSLEMENLYIVDPKNKRVVVFDKNGKLVNQYVSDSFDDLKDIYVNEKEGKMYLLCNKRIFGIELEKKLE